MTATNSPIPPEPGQGTTNPSTDSELIDFNKDPADKPFDPNNFTLTSMHSLLTTSGTATALPNLYLILVFGLHDHAQHLKFHKKKAAAHAADPASLPPRDRTSCGAIPYHFPSGHSGPRSPPDVILDNENLHRTFHDQLWAIPGERLTARPTKQLASPKHSSFHSLLM
ncbi:hypothetical protein BDN71DRAFT_1431460 [Pleurotus eryngii]|uniref:Uncharacterized protein n=1 Tax=Pleurotus eryngii TaxID=5323 RepID=A0A9P5ZUR7_PLEER|nr:hypothetical protein BDN71DRAFT_1431460 [Pleurotus eryngii]